MKKVIKITLCFVIIISAIMMISHGAKAEIANGTWGKLKWSLSDEGKLTISGSGAMLPFGSFTSIEAWRAYSDNIESVVIEKGVVSIGDYAFCCTDIKSIQIPDSLLSIGTWAFYRCENLLAISLPSKLEALGSGAFWHCYSLSSVTIPSGVKQIGFATFNECKSLKTVNISKGTETIGSEAFADCSQLTNVKLPTTLVVIETSAFSDCISLKEIQLPSKLRSIYSRAFSGCVVMDKVFIPESVNYIGDVAFSGHTIIECVKGSYAANWANAAGYQVKYVSSESGSQKTVTIKGLKYKIDSKNKTAVFVMPENKNVTTITIPATIKSSGKTYKVIEIAANACKKMTNLTKVTIGKNVTKIGKNAFNGCKKLKTINISKATQLTKKGIGSACFKGIDSKAIFKCPKKNVKDYKTWLIKTGKAPKKSQFK